MNKLLKILVLLLASSISVPALAEVSNNTIRFTGAIADELCTIKVNGNSETSVILLPTINVNELGATGDTAGDTLFTVAVENCYDHDDSILISSHFTSTASTVNHNIPNTESDNGVSFQLFDPLTRTEIYSDGTATPGLDVAPDSSSATYDYGVRYYAEGAVTPGKVSGDVQYFITYN